VKLGEIHGCLVGHIIKNQHIHFLVHGHSFGSTFILHLVRGPKALQIVFFMGV
jgi:hypothetical protein